MNGGTCSSPGACSCTSDWSGIRCIDRELLKLNLILSSAEYFVVKSVYYTLIQLSVTQAVLTEVTALLLAHVPVFLNGLDPLAQLVRLHTAMCKYSQFHLTTSSSSRF